MLHYNQRYWLQSQFFVFRIITLLSFVIFRYAYPVFFERITILKARVDNLEMLYIRANSRILFFRNFYINEISVPHMVLLISTLIEQ